MEQNLEQISYFFGAWLGDGWESGGNVGIEIGDFEIIFKCCEVLENFFSDLKEPSFMVRKRPSGNIAMMRATWSSVYFSRFLGSLTANKDKLPDYIWTASRKARMELLVGLMDTDGSIEKCISPRTRTGYSYALSFSGVHGFVEFVPYLFESVEIKVGKITTFWPAGDNTIRKTRFKMNLESAIRNGFYFNCKRKMERLKDYALKFMNVQL